MHARVIPCLLLKGNGLVKTIKFSNYNYVGDPINAVKIFNESEVDELILLDITATNEKKVPNLKLITEIVSEAFMPVSYGGGINSIADAREILRCGVEKIVICTQAIEDSNFLLEASKIFGSSSVVGCLDIKKKNLSKYEVYTHCGKKKTKLNPIEYAKTIEEKGAGELVINSIDLDGTMSGYDLDLIKKISEVISIPLVACGGAGNLNDFKLAIENGASAVAAGSLFVYQGRHRAVLINYPSKQELNKTIFKNG